MGVYVSYALKSRSSAEDPSAPCWNWPRSGRGGYDPSMRSVVVRSCLVAALLALALVGRSLASDESQELRPDFGSYELDAMPRQLPEGTRRFRCPTEGIVRYRGTSIGFWIPAPMHAAFVPYVQRFEALVREVAIETYGRAPYRLSHIGAYVCRRIRGSGDMISEHALGNAIDVRAFDFVAARRDQALPEGAPPSLSRPFRVSIEDHWHADRGVGAYHAAFFARLRERLADAPDLFGVMLGPSYPGHSRHLHLDRAPWKFVQF